MASYVVMEPPAAKRQTRREPTRRSSATASPCSPSCCRRSGCSGTGCGSRRRWPSPRSVALTALGEVAGLGLRRRGCCRCWSRSIVGLEGSGAAHRRAAPARLARDGASSRPTVCDDAETRYLLQPADDRAMARRRATLSAPSAPRRRRRRRAGARPARLNPGSR